MRGEPRAARLAFALRRLAPILSVLLAPAMLSGCTQPGVPVLSNLTFHGQAPDSPLVLLLAVDFSDDDGDFSQGELQTFINQRPTEKLNLLPLFLDNGLEDGALSGTLDFVLEIAFSSDIPDAGTTFTLGARAEDGSGHVSGTQEMKLKLEGGG